MIGQWYPRQPLTIRTIPEVVEPKARTHSSYILWSGEFCSTQNLLEQSAFSIKFHCVLEGSCRKPKYLENIIHHFIFVFFLDFFYHSSCRNDQFTVLNFNSTVKHFPLMNQYNSKFKENSCTMISGFLATIK